MQALGEHKILSGGGDGQVVEWDVNNPTDGKVIAKVGAPIYGMVVDGEKLLVGENSRALHMLDLESGDILRSIQIKSPIFDVKRIGNRYFIGTGAGELFVFDLNLDLVKRLKLSSKSLRCISALDGQIALGYSDAIIRIMNEGSLEVIHELNGHTLSVFGMQYHPETKVLISTGRDAHIRVWDRFDGYSCFEDIAAHNYASNHVEFHPNKEYFATASMDKTIKIWDATTFALNKVIDKVRHDGHTNSVNKLLWMEFENLLVTCSDDRTIAVWDIKFD